MAKTNNRDQGTGAIASGVRGLPGRAAAATGDVRPSGPSYRTRRLTKAQSEVLLRIATRTVTPEAVAQETGLSVETVRRIVTEHASGFVLYFPALDRTRHGEYATDHHRTRGDRASSQGRRVRFLPPDSADGIRARSRRSG